MTPAGAVLLIGADLVLAVLVCWRIYARTPSRRALALFYVLLVLALAGLIAGVLLALP